MTERYFVLVHHNGKITNTEEEAAFCCQNSIGVSASPSVALMLRKLQQLNSKQITQVLYKLPIAFGQGVVHYTGFSVRSDDDMSHVLLSLPNS